MFGVRSCGRRAGVSLVESIVAIYLLTGAILTVFLLFDHGLRISGETSKQSKLVLVAQRRLEEIRAWAATLSGGAATNFNNIASLAAAGPDLKDPDVTVNVQAAIVTIFNPDTNSESAWGAGAKTMVHSVAKVQVKTSFGGPENVTLVTLIREPAMTWRSGSPMTLASSAQTVASLASFSNTAQGFSSSGALINDLGVRWHVNPIDSSGDIKPGHQDDVVYTNRFFNSWTNGYASQPGTLKLQAESRYGGVLQNVTCDVTNQ